MDFIFFLKGTYFSLKFLYNTSMLSKRINRPLFQVLPKEIKKAFILIPDDTNRPAPKPISFLYIPTIPNLRKSQECQSDSQPMAFLLLSNARHLRKRGSILNVGYAEKLIFSYIFGTHSLQSQTFVAIPHKSGS